MFHADGWIDMMQSTHTHTHTVAKSSATQKFMTYAIELMFALVHKGGVVVSSGKISYQVSHT